MKINTRKMRKQTLLITGFLLIALVACNKQVKIEKNLWKGGGEWKIERYESQNVSTYAPDNFNFAESNFGTFTFNKDGSGHYVFTGNGSSESGNLIYSNTEDELLMTMGTNSFVYTMNWEKNSIQISREEQYANSVGSGIYTEKYWLEKK
jgi:hypothetical protein